jgi:hypothetical protein
MLLVKAMARIELQLMTRIFRGFLSPSLSFSPKSIHWSQ